MSIALCVPADKLIRALARHLKENVKEVKPPAWAAFVKTGKFKQRPPDDPDWWYTRAASLLRRLYVDGPVGLSKLRTVYGGRHRRGFIREHSAKAGGAIIRKALQQLEQAKLVAHDKRGRFLTPEGRSLVDRLAHKLFKEAQKEMPELKKYSILAK